MNKVVITIEDGEVKFLVNDATSPMLDDDSIVRRASHVQPTNPLAKLIFHGLRRLFGEKGKMASFTRLWPCLWEIDLSPIGGPTLPGHYRDRQQAIDAEIDYLQENFI